MKITIVTPVWKRPAVSIPVIASWPRNEIWNTVIVGSEGAASRELYEGFGSYIEYPNKPLGAKFNAGILHALAEGADYVLIMGSDTLATGDAWGRWQSLAVRGVAYAGVRDAWIVNAVEARLWPGYTNHRAGQPIGPGRLLSAATLRASALYHPDLSFNLDASLDATLPEPDYVLELAESAGFASLKTSGSITSTGRYKGVTETIRASEFLRFYHPDLIGLAPLLARH